jgi:cellulose biosynthesis protein BcsQ
MNTLANKHAFDVIIVDLSPSNSALNEISALSCNYILPPCNASLYSCAQWLYLWLV